MKIYKIIALLGLFATTASMMEARSYETNTPPSYKKTKLVRKKSHKFQPPMVKQDPNISDSLEKVGMEA